MAHIDNEFNKRFSNQQLPNDDFDTEGLWDAISEDMDSGQAAPDTHISMTKWLLGLVVLLVIGGILGVFYLKSDDNINHVITQKTDNNIDNSITNTHQNHAVVSHTNPKSDAITAPSNPKENDSKNIQTNTKLTNATNTIPQKNELKKSTDIEQVGTSDISTNPFPTHNNTQKITSSKHTSFTKNTSTQTTNFNDKTITPSPPLIPVINSSNTTLIDHVITDNLTKPLTDNPIEDNPIISTDDPVEVSLFVLPPVDALVESSTPNQSITLPSSALQTTKNQELKNISSQSIQWNAGLETGINTVHTHHRSDDYSDLADLKNMTSKQGLGTNYGINAGLLLKDRWLLSGGIEYHQLWSKFDYKQEEQIQVTKEDQLLHLWVDRTTGDTLKQLYGDTIVNAISTRTVLHYNKFQRLSIPLEIGVQKNAGKFIYGITAGAVFNFTNKQSGRTLDTSGEIVNFDKNDATALYKPFHIGLRINPLVGYQLSERWSLTLRPQWTWHQNNNFDNTDIKTGFHQFNVNVGLRYSFDSR